MPRRPVHVRPALRLLAVGALLFGGTILLFSRMIGYGFTNYDDPRYILNNPYVQQGFSPAAFKWAFVGNADYWHPLTWFSHVLDWQLFGDIAAGHHLTSAVWHAVNAVLALLLFRRLAGGFGSAIVGAVLFAWHPLRVESVAWVTERKDVMSGCFFLLTIWAYVSYADRVRDGRPARGRYLAALISFVAGLMCKPTLVTVPFVLLALDFWPVRRVAYAATPDGSITPPRGVLVDKLPFFALSAITAAVTIKMQEAIGAFTLELPLAARIANAPVAITRYLGKLVWPANLSVCYPHPGWWQWWATAGSTLLVTAITILVWRHRSRAPWLVTGWVWFVALLLPTLGLVQVGFQSLADRYTYVPMLGCSLFVAAAARQCCVTARARILAASAAVLVLFGFAVRTWEQQATWRDSATLFRHAIATTSRNDVAEAFLAYTLASEGKLEEAADHCRRALAVNPENEMAVYTLAGIHAGENRNDDAIAGYRKALQLKPGDSSSDYALGILLLKQGRGDEASMHLRAAARRQPTIVADNLRLAWRNARNGLLPQAAAQFSTAVIYEPGNADAHFGLGRTLIQLGRERDGVASLEQALALRPDFCAAHLELGLALLKGGAPAEATAHFRAAQTVPATSVSALVGLARAEELLGERSEADEAFRQALAAGPDDPEVVRAWADTLARRGQFSAAVRQYQRAVQLRPGDAANHAGLGFVLYLTGRRAEAVQAWKEALRLDPHFPGLRERLAQAENR